LLLWKIYFKKLLIKKSAEMNVWSVSNWPRWKCAHKVSAGTFPLTLPCTFIIYIIRGNVIYKNCRHESIGWRLCRLNLKQVWIFRDHMALSKLGII
jgi:hypothetical protein